MYEENVSHEDFIQTKINSSHYMQLVQAKPLKTMKVAKIGHFKELSFTRWWPTLRLKGTVV
jgi:hypothetical protein